MDSEAHLVIDKWLYIVFDRDVPFSTVSLVFPREIHQSVDGEAIAEAADATSVVFVKETPWIRCENHVDSKYKGRRYFGVLRVSTESPDSRGSTSTNRIERNRNRIDCQCENGEIEYGLNERNRAIPEIGGILFGG